MDISNAIEKLKRQIKWCIDDCEGECGDYENGICGCAEATVISTLEDYMAIGTIDQCKKAVLDQKTKNTHKANTRKERNL